jgi:hypothetical protein
MAGIDHLRLSLKELTEALREYFSQAEEQVEMFEEERRTILLQAEALLKDVRDREALTAVSYTLERVLRMTGIPYYVTRHLNRFQAAYRAQLQN